MKCSAASLRPVSGAEPNLPGAGGQQQRMLWVWLMSALCTSSRRHRRGPGWECQVYFLTAVYLSSCGRPPGRTHDCLNTHVHGTEHCCMLSWVPIHALTEHFSPMPGLRRNGSGRFNLCIAGGRPIRIGQRAGASLQGWTAAATEGTSALTLAGARRQGRVDRVRAAVQLVGQRQRLRARLQHHRHCLHNVPHLRVEGALSVHLHASLAD